LKEKERVSERLQKRTCTHKQEGAAGAVLGFGTTKKYKTCFALKELSQWEKYKMLEM